MCSPLSTFNEFRTSSIFPAFIIYPGTGGWNHTREVVRIWATNVNRLYDLH